MKTHSLIPNTPEWLAYRKTMFNASDAPAMMGVSAYKTRTQLLHELHTGMAPDIDAATQRLFDDGHKFEAMARPLAEAIIGMELYPVTGSEGKLSASFDGLTMCETIAFEHKTLNKDLVDVLHADCKGFELPLQYQVQMEQQLMVSGADKCLFMASKWNGDTLIEERHCWYKSIPDLRIAIVAGWNQFAADLAAYVPTETVAAPVGKSPETLPALHIEVTGMVTASNLAEYKAHALAVFASVNRELVTDQDFADAKKAIKWAGDIETRLQGAKQHALSQTESIDALFRTIDDISEEARRVRLDLNNMVKSRETTLKAEIVADGRNALADHVAACAKRIGRPFMPAIPADFAAAIKGMSKFENMRNAVATELARAKIEANAIADKIDANLRHLSNVNAPMFLFSDLQLVCLKPVDDFQMLVKVRINDHAEKESARLAAETARIAEQERVKAEAAAQARANAEIAAARAQADAEMASAEAIAKAQATQYEELEKSEIKRLDDLNNTMVVASALINDLCNVPPSHLSPPTLKLGVICTRLGFQVTADFLKSLGFEPAGRERAAVLFHESDFDRICAALISHISAVRQGVAA